MPGNPTSLSACSRTRIPSPKHLPRTGPRRSPPGWHVWQRLTCAGWKPSIAPTRKRSARPSRVSTAIPARMETLASRRGASWGRARLHHRRPSPYCSTARPAGTPRKCSAPSRSISLAPAAVSWAATAPSAGFTASTTRAPRSVCRWTLAHCGPSPIPTRSASTTSLAMRLSAVSCCKTPSTSSPGHQPTTCCSTATAGPASRPASRRCSTHTVTAGYAS